MCCHGTHNHSNFHAISCVAMGTVISPRRGCLKGRQRDGEKRSIFRSKTECLSTSPHAVFHQQINLSISSLSSVSNLTSMGFFCPYINLHLYKDCCMLWIYSRKASSVYHFVALYYWCSFYVPFDPLSCQYSPLTLLGEGKKIKNNNENYWDELLAKPHAVSSQPYVALVCASLTNCSPTNHFTEGNLFFLVTETLNHQWHHGHNPPPSSLFSSFLKSLKSSFRPIWYDFLLSMTEAVPVAAMQACKYMYICTVCNCDEVCSVCTHTHAQPNACTHTVRFGWMTHNLEWLQKTCLWRVTSYWWNVSSTLQVLQDRSSDCEETVQHYRIW